MPELPRYRNQEVAATNQLRVVKQARTDLPDMGEPLRTLGQAAVAVEKKINTARVQSEVVRANSALRKELDAAYRDLERDGEGDYDAFESRFAERAREIRSRVLGDLKTSGARRLMSERAIGMEDDYTLKVRTLRRTRGIADVKSTISGQVEDYQQAAEDITTPSERLAEMRSEIDTYAATMHASGFLNDMEVEQLAQGTDRITLSGMTKRIEQNVESLLNSGRTAEAVAFVRDQYSNMDPATRDNFVTAVEQKAKEVEAVATSDRLFAQTSGDLRAAYAEADKIEDPEQRRAVRSELSLRSNQQKAAMRQEMIDATEQAERIVYVDGGSTASIPLAVRNTMDPKTYAALKSYETSVSQSQARGASPYAQETNPDALMQYYDLMSEGKSEQARALLYNNVDAFTDSDFKSLYKDASSPADQATVRGLYSDRQLVTTTAERAGMKSEKQQAEMLHTLHRWKIQFGSENGRAPNQTEIEEFTEEQAVKMRFSQRGWFNDNVAPGMIELPGVPERHKVAVMSAFAEEGFERSTPEDMELYYQSALNQLRQHDVEPTPQSITAAINALRARARLEGDQ